MQLRCFLHTIIFPNKKDTYSWKDDTLLNYTVSFLLDVFQEGNLVLENTYALNLLFLKDLRKIKYTLAEWASREGIDIYWAPILFHEIFKYTILSLSLDNNQK